MRARADRAQVGWSVEGLSRVHRHARSHVPALFRALCAHRAAAAPELLWPVRSLAGSVGRACVPERPQSCRVPFTDHL